MRRSHRRGPFLVGRIVALWPAVWLAGALGDERPTLDRVVRAATTAEAGPAIDDATFLRRVHLDLTGRIPSPPEARAFLDDGDPGRRAKLVDRLLASEEFRAHWGRVLARWATDERPVFRDQYDGRILAESLGDAIRAGRPYPEIVRDLVTGLGATDSSGPANFLLRYEADPIKLAGGVGKNLLGVTIACAQCHNHPFAPWQQDDFWGMAAVFARLRRMNSEDGEPLRAIVEARRGELTRPDMTAPAAAAGQDEQMSRPEIRVKPRLPGGEAIGPNADRRRVLADWMTADENPYLLRQFANKLWGELFGRPLVRNLDDPGKSTESTPVLDALVADFRDFRHDLRPLIREVVLSDTYAQAAGSADDPAAWSRPLVRPLSVDALFASIVAATGFEPQDGGEPEDEEDDDAAEPEEPPATIDPDHPIEEPATRNDRAADQLGERGQTLQRTLVLMNGGYITEASRSGGRIARTLLGPKIGPKHVEWAFLSTLARRPTGPEVVLMLDLVRKAPQTGLEDVYWVLLNSAEFQSQH